MHEVEKIEQTLKMCEVILKAMSDVKAEYMNTVYTTIASMVIAIGWILTSKEARSFISKHYRIKQVIIGSTLFIWVFHYVNVLLISVRSWSLRDKMQEICNQTPVEVIKSYEIFNYWPVASMVFNGVLFAGFTILVTNIRSNKYKVSQTNNNLK